MHKDLKFSDGTDSSPRVFDEIYKKIIDSMKKFVV